MGRQSTIEWTDSTWNPVVGCTKVSAGCKYCYAETMVKRFKRGAAFPNGFNLTLKPHKLREPLKWREPRRVFVNSMSDLFHPQVPRQYLDRVFSVMESAEQHQFQVLTKRSVEMRDYVNQRYKYFGVPEHVWLGVSVENKACMERLDDLAQVRDGFVKFVSFEPLLENLGAIGADRFDWVIVGGESGAGARAMSWEWVDSIYQQCQGVGVPFFFKQWGGVHKKRAGRLFRGREWDEMPKKGNKL